MRPISSPRTGNENLREGRSHECYLMLFALLIHFIAFVMTQRCTPAGCGPFPDPGAIPAPISELYVPNTSSLIPETIDTLTPETIDALVEQRVRHRSAREFDKADSILAILQQRGVDVFDLPFKGRGGGSTWKFAPLEPPSTDTSLMSLIAKCINEDDEIDEKELLREIKTRLEAEEAFLQVPTHNSRSKGSLKGRKCADAAFALATGGIKDHEIYGLLSKIAIRELQRWGPRPSVRALDILQVAEKLATAGIEDQAIYSLAASLLRSKPDAASAQSIQELSSGSYSLLSNRPLCLLWRYAARQAKSGQQNKSRHIRGVDEAGTLSEDGFNFEDDCEYLSGDDEDLTHSANEATTPTPLPSSLAELFADPTLPLIVDCGCGFGTTLLGLSKSAVGQGYNYLGIDMSRQALKFAKGISSRWGASPRCAFLHSDALSGLQWLSSQQKIHRSNVHFVLFQFPTPFKLSSHGKAKVGGNAQLPASELNAGFMVTESLLNVAADILANNRSDAEQGRHGIYVSSNCEDVAVFMRELAERTDRFSPPAEPEHAVVFPSVTGPDQWMGVSEIVTQRQVRWITSEGSSVRRAAGRGWLSYNPLSELARTETEAMCELFNKPVFRFLYFVKDSSYHFGT